MQLCWRVGLRGLRTRGRYQSIRPGGGTRNGTAACGDAIGQCYENPGAPAPHGRRTDAPGSLTQRQLAAMTGIRLSCCACGSVVWPTAGGENCDIAWTSDATWLSISW